MSGTIVILIFVALIGLAVTAAILAKRRLDATLAEESGAEGRAVNQPVTAGETRETELPAAAPIVADRAEAAAPIVAALPRVTEEKYGLGASTKEVMRIQGVPQTIESSYRTTTFKYGRDEVCFEGGKCTSWSNFGGSLKVHMSSRSRATAFTLGSTKDDVVAAMGTPNLITWGGSRFEYGDQWLHSAEIDFDNNRVKSWKNSRNRLKLQPAGTDANAFFTMGSSKNEVVAVHGAPESVSADGKVYTCTAQPVVQVPDSFGIDATTADVMRIQGVPDAIKTGTNTTTFTYGLASVQFYDGRCYGWLNDADVLKVRMPTRSKARFFTLGSSKDDVIAAMGTPTNVSWNGTRFEYGSGCNHTAGVDFKDNRVSGWQNCDNRLKLTLASVDANATFTLGAPKKEVEDMHGAPLSVSTDGRTYTYPEGTVVFDTKGRVEGWTGTVRGRVR